MDRERAETYLRLLAEAELRRATTIAAGSLPGQWRSTRLEVVAQALRVVGAVGVDIADDIQADLGLAVAGRYRLSIYRVGRPGSGATPQRASCRVVPAGQVIKIRSDDLRGELLVVACAQSTGGARLIVVGRPFPPFAVADDRGVSYQITWSGGHTASELLLRPGPSHPIRWLDVTGAVEAATRIDLARQIPGPDVIVTPTAHSPGELLLEVIAARILSIVAYRPRDNPGPLTASADLRAFIGSGPGHIVAALHGADVLAPDSPVPGQLAGLCARLGIDGHGITAPPDRDLPERWQSLLTPTRSRTPQPRPAPAILAATVAELPEPDGVKIVIVGLTHSLLPHGEPRTIMHLLASGVTLEDDWKFARGVIPLPVLWIRGVGHEIVTSLDDQPPFLAGEGLSDFDEVAVGVAQVAAQLASAVADRLGEELRAPQLISHARGHRGQAQRPGTTPNSARSSGGQACGPNCRPVGQVTRAVCGYGSVVSPTRSALTCQSRAAAAAS